jgi:hypothetical protein
MAQKGGPIFYQCVEDTNAQRVRPWTNLLHRQQSKMSSSKKIYL